MSAAARPWPRVGVALVALACARPAVAAEPSRRAVALVYTVEPGLTDCPSEESFRAAVARRVGFPALLPSTARTPDRLEVQLSRSGGLPVAEVALFGPAGEQGRRRLAPAEGDCEALGRLLTFVVAVTLGLDPAAEPTPEPRAERLPPPKPAAPPPPPKRVAAPAPVVAKTEAPAAKEELAQAAEPLAPSAPLAERSFELGGVAGWGALPSGAFAPLLGGTIAAPTTSLGLELRVTPIASTFAAPSGGFSAREAALVVVPCLRRGALHACAAVLGSLTRAEGRRLDEPKSSAGLGLRAGPRLAVRWPLAEGFGVALSATVAWPLVSVRVDVDGREAWRTGSPSVEAAAAICRWF